MGTVSKAGEGRGSEGAAEDNRPRSEGGNQVTDSSGKESLLGSKCRAICKELPKLVMSV